VRFAGRLFLHRKHEHVTRFTRSGTLAIDFTFLNLQSVDYGRSGVAPYLPGNIWEALLDINEHVTTPPIDEVEKRILRDGLEILAVKLAEASKRYHISLSNWRLSGEDGIIHGTQD
jgi:hypothetical protein